MTDNEVQPESVYGARRDRFGELRAQYERRSSRQGNVNLLLFVLAGLLAGLGLWLHRSAFFAAAGIAGLVFVAALVYHERINQGLRRYTTLVALNEEGLARLARAWDALPLPERASPAPAAPPPGAGQAFAAPGAAGGDPSPMPDRELARVSAESATIPGALRGTTAPMPGSDPMLAEHTAFDLDLLGRASLQHLLGTANTPAGQAVVRRWIMQPAASEAVRLRQAAIVELAPLVDWRDEVGVLGRLMGPAQADYERLIAWAEGEGWLRRRPGLLWLARALTLLSLGLLTAGLLGADVLPALGIVLLANAMLALGFSRELGQEIEAVAARQAVFRAYADIFRLITEQRFVAPCLTALQAQLAAGQLSANDHMRRLSRLMPAAELRHSLLFFLLEVPTLWSFHLLWLLERWQAVAGGHVREWLAALGETEALIALATLHHDHPTWAFPVLLEPPSQPKAGGAVFSAQKLAHPLLPPQRAVDNDVQVGPPGRFLLVTGSNMSGKSTLLRAIGVNTVLAQMGGPVCAAQLALPPLVLATSMRVQDSLEQGISSYMAQLRRLKAIIDLADEQQARSPTLLFLLDEILQGTNKAERQIAARRIIMHLVNSGAIGAVSTHDLTLADEPEIAAASVPVHFSETFTRDSNGPAMSFDYRLRPGIATSTNALKLMEIIGLPAK